MLSLLRTNCAGRDLADAALIIEAVFEDLGVKQSLLARIEPLVAATAIIATNTSCLGVGDIGSVLTKPERFVGLHFFSPAEINPVVEVISGPQTDPQYVHAASDWISTLGKTPIPCKDSPGFAINRFFCPYANEAARCLDEGMGTTAEIDAIACEIFDLALGPFAVMNITKPEILLHAQQSLAKLGPFYEPSARLSAQCLTGKLWEIEECPLELRDSQMKLVADRLMDAIFFAASQVLHEGVAGKNDIDTGARLALRFGRPPFALMESIGAAATARIVQALKNRHASR